MRSLQTPFVFAAILAVLLGGGAYLVWKQETPPQQFFQVSNFVENAIENANPMAYAELTIPYLRAREYSSTLGELERLRATSTYTSYLTSYDSDGLQINALLTQPSGEQPENGWPAIVFVHGYIPPHEYRTQEKYVEYVDYLARNGFVVLKIDLRGHGSSEGEPGGAYYSTDYIIDTLNARAALQVSDFVDQSKVGLWGHSMAGNVVLRSLAVRPEIPAAVIWGGAVFTYDDFGKYRIQDNSYQPPDPSSMPEPRRRRQEIFDTHGEVSLDSPFWQLVSPKQYLGDIQGKIQLHHAVNDDVVNVGYSRDLVPLLDAAGVEHEFYEYSSGGHNISGSSFGTAMQRTAAFFPSM